MTLVTKMDAPPPIPPRPPGFYHSTPQQPQQPQLPPRPSSSFSQPQGPSPGSFGDYSRQDVPQGFPAPPQQPPPAPSAWNEHLFYSNGRPTPLFEALMKEFFVRLDPRATGYIIPEAFSSFLDVCHYNVEGNVWKKNLKGNLMFSAEDMADSELKATMEGFYFDHKVVVRNPGAKQLPYGGMPLISLAGFTDWLSIDFAAGPDEHLGGLNNALRHYGVWPEKGPLPRYIFPATVPRELENRISEASLRCRNAASSKLDALKAQSMMEARGRQNALDLISDNRYYYY